MSNSSGKQVVIKIVERAKINGGQYEEVAILSRMRHRNIVRLLEVRYSFNSCRRYLILHFSGCGKKARNTARPRISYWRGAVPTYARFASPLRYCVTSSPQLIPLLGELATHMFCLCTPNILAQRMRLDAIGSKLWQQ